MAKPKTVQTNTSDKKDPTLGKIDEKKILEQVTDHAASSWEYMQPIRKDFDEKEALIICKLKDEMSAETDAKVFDPELNTIAFERTARVMAQSPRGKAYATSKNDIGKNRLMNLLREYYYKHATFWRPMLIKERMMDFYSQVYGTMFALTPWIDQQPEMIPWPIRMCWPDPHATSVHECTYFQMGSMKSLAWLEKRSKETWMNIDELKKKVMGDTKDGEAITSDNLPEDQQSFIQTTYYQQNTRKTIFPMVEVRTEYRNDRWITFAPKYDLILRAIKNPYGDKEQSYWGDLPIVAKDCFPLIDSIIGLGEFERGKTLQYAMNSLINLYLDGVKYSIFPPMQMDPKKVIMSSVKWGAGEKWFLKDGGMPNVHIQETKLSPQGLSTFQSTFGFLKSIMMNQAGTTNISTSEGTDAGMGKTPQAVRMAANRESARDEWDRVMMEVMIEDRENKWINMIVNKLEKPVLMRIFGAEAEDINKEYPDVMEFFDNKQKYGSMAIKPEMIKAKYDFVLETGSTMKPDLEGEAATMQELFVLITKDPNFAPRLGIDEKQLFREYLNAKKLKNIDKILPDNPEQPTGVPGQEMPGQMPQSIPGQPVNAQNPAQVTPEMMEQFAAEIEQSAQGPEMPPLLGNSAGIPAMPYGQ